MRIIALMSWYDENPAWLAGAVASLRGIADHIVAVDGAYALYPQGKAVSDRPQAEAIRETARGLKMGCTVHEPCMTWWGNEVEKRSFMFRLGEQVADEGDWYIVLDGDEVVTSCGYNMHAELEKCPHDVGEVRMWNYREHFEPHQRPFVSDRIEHFKIRILFRALPGLSVVGKHYHYKLPDGRYLWCDGTENMEPAATFEELRVEHRQRSRDLWRDKQRQEYYQRREATKVEVIQ